MTHTTKGYISGVLSYMGCQSIGAYLRREELYIAFVKTYITNSDITLMVGVVLLLMGVMLYTGSIHNESKKEGSK